MPSEQGVTTIEQTPAIEHGKTSLPIKIITSPIRARIASGENTRLMNQLDDLDCSFGDLQSVEDAARSSNLQLFY